MDDARVETLAALLLAAARRDRRVGVDPPPAPTALGVRRRMKGPRGDGVASDADLDPRMYAVFLRAAAVPDERWAAVDLLASLRRRGEADGLPAVLADEGASPGVRLAAARSMIRAGEEPPIAPLVDALEEARELEVRLGLILTLGRSRSAVSEAAVLVALDDPNRQVRAAGAIAAREQASAAAVPRLGAILAEPVGADTQHVVAALGRLGAAGSAEATAHLADALARFADARPELVPAALDAFAAAAGQRDLVEAARYDGAAARVYARLALRWWREMRGREPAEQARVLAETLATEPTTWALDRLGRLGRLGCAEATAALGDYLVGLDDDVDFVLLSHALAAFEASTGERFSPDREDLETTAEARAAYREAAAAAATWWEERSR